MWSTSSRANSCATENPTNDKAAAELGVRALVRTLEYPHEESVATHDCKIVGSGKVTDGLCEPLIERKARRGEWGHGRA